MSGQPDPMFSCTSGKPARSLRSLTHCAIQITDRLSAGMMLFVSQRAPGQAGQQPFQLLELLLSLKNGV